MTAEELERINRWAESVVGRANDYLDHLPHVRTIDSAMLEFHLVGIKTAAFNAAVVAGRLAVEEPKP